MDDRTQSFHLQLSHQAFLEFQELQVLLADTVINLQMNDSWSTVPEGCTYRASQFYKHCF